MKKYALLALISVTLCSCAALKAGNAEDRPLAVIGVVTDIHYYRDKEPRINRYYTMSADKLTEAVRTFNEEKVDFMISLGDTFDPDLACYDDIAQAFASFHGPVYKVLGNHDCIAPYGSQEENEVFKALGIKSPYYSIRKKGLRFIFIDGNDISVQSTADGTAERKDAERTIEALKKAKAANARNYNGKLSQKQKEWLRSELDKAQKKGETVYIFGHMPLLPQNIMAAQWDGEEIDAMLQQYPNVKAVLSGHHHKGAQARSGHIQHYTFQGLIEGTDNHYAIVRIYRDRLDITGYGKQPSESFTISE